MHKLDFLWEKLSDLKLDFVNFYRKTEFDMYSGEDVHTNQPNILRIAATIVVVIALIVVITRVFS